MHETIWRIVRMTDQGILPGLEVYFVETAPKKRKPATPWKPRPGTLARVKVYFQGYVAHGRDIYARRKHIGERLGISERTVSRYIAWLVAEGWIETIRRTARTAIRKVLAVLNFSSSSVTPSGRPIEVTPPSTKVLRKTDPPSPLVVFQVVYRRFARKHTKATPKKENRWDRMRRWAEEETVRLRALGVKFHGDPDPA